MNQLTTNNGNTKAWHSHIQFPKRVSKALKNLLANIRKYMKKQGHLSIKGKRIAGKTISSRRIILNKMAHDLHDADYKIENLKYLKLKHLHALFDAWIASGISGGVIQTRTSLLRTVEVWINKPGLTDNAISSYPNRALFISRSKRPKAIELPNRSWSSNGVNPVEIINVLMEIDFIIAIQVALQYMFGLRAMESMMFKPVDSHNGDTISVMEGAKNGRRRDGVKPIALDSS